MSQFLFVYCIIRNLSQVCSGCPPHHPRHALLLQLYLMTFLKTRERQVQTMPWRKMVSISSAPDWRGWMRAYPSKTAKQYNLLEWYLGYTCVAACKVHCLYLNTWTCYGNAFVSLWFSLSCKSCLVSYQKEKNMIRAKTQSMGGRFRELERYWGTFQELTGLPITVHVLHHAIGQWGFCVRTKLVWNILVLYSLPFVIQSNVFVHI